MAVSTDEDTEHYYRWRMVYHLLEEHGYQMHWEWVALTQSRRYALTRWSPRETLGIFDDEQTARNMAQLLIKQAQLERE